VVPPLRLTVVIVWLAIGRIVDGSGPRDCLRTVVVAHDLFLPTIIPSRPSPYNIDMKAPDRACRDRAALAEREITAAYHGMMKGETLCLSLPSV